MVARLAAPFATVNARCWLRIPRTAAAAARLARFQRTVWPFVWTAPATSLARTMPLVATCASISGAIPRTAGRADKPAPIRPADARAAPGANARSAARPDGRAAAMPVSIYKAIRKTAGDVRRLATQGSFVRAVAAKTAAKTAYATAGAHASTSRRRQTTAESATRPVPARTTAARCVATRPAISSARMASKSVTRAASTPGRVRPTAENATTSATHPRMALRAAKLASAVRLATSAMPSAAMRA